MLYLLLAKLDWLGLNSTLEDNYNCLVCRALNDSSKAPSESQVWLLNVANKTVIKPADFTTWGEALKSKIEQVVVAQSKYQTLYVRMVLSIPFPRLRLAQ